MIKKILPILFLIFSVLIFFHKLFYPRLQLVYTPDFGSSDAFHFNYSLKDFLSQSLKNKQLPLWTDNLGNGFPILAEGQIGTFNLFNLLLFKFLPTYLAFNLSIIIIFSTLIIGQYLFLATIGLSIGPAVLGAIAFAFSAYFTAKLTHFNHLQAASFFPLILCLVESYLKKAKIKYLIFIVFLFSQQIFSGYPLMVFITFLLILFRLIFHLWQKKIKPLKTISFFVPFVIAAVLTLGLNAIQILPQIEYLKLSNLKSGFSFEQITHYHYPPKNLLNFLQPFIIGNPVNGSYDSAKYGIFWENSSFLGIVPLILAICSLFLWRKSWVKYFFCLSLVSLLLSFGQYSPLYFVFTIFPFNLFRVPSRYLIIIIFSLSVLSAIFLEKLKKRLKTSVFYSFFLIILLFTFSQLYSFFAFYHLLVDKNELLKEPKILNVLKNEAGFQKVYTYAASISWNKHFKTSWHDQTIFLFFKNNLQPNSNLVWQIASANIYATQFPLRLVFYQNSVLGIKSRQEVFTKEFLTPLSLEKLNQGLKITGISHLILPTEIKNSPWEKLKTLKFDDEKIYLYKISNPNPKFWIADNYKLAKTVQELEKIIQDPNFDYQKTVVLEKNPDLSSGQNNKQGMEIIKDTHQQKIIKVTNNKTSSLLVITQSFYPGWQALIDNQKTEILAANLNQQAVLVPPGNHTINFVYKPASFYLGAKISLISLLILFVLFLLAANRNLQTPLPFVRPENTQDKFFLKRPKQKHRQG